jgi:murein DD-endopeptidase MepM/ murein hydrolase activator NlpD
MSGRSSAYISVAAVPFRLRITPRAMALMLLCLGAAGCSADPNGNVDPYRRQSEATGFFRPDRQSMAQSLRPPMPLLEEPVSRPVGVRPADVGAHEQDGPRHAAATAARPPAPKPAAASRHATELAEAAKPKRVAPEPKTHGRDSSVPDAKRVNAQPLHEIAVGPQAPPQPAPAAPAPQPSIDASAPIGSLKAAEAGSTFYWPVRGQLIAGFGAKINGQPNNGIDVAVPEDTPVKAADDGTVLYAGNGLKSYGNLLLVRHPNGYVTVYAHAKELLVKVGDEIKRGQIIAKSGRTGDVDRPQIHFEIRKASAPVNPLPYLNGA